MKHGLEPTFYGLTDNEFVSDDGYIYDTNTGEQIAPWYAVLHSRHDFNRADRDDRSWVFRRSSLDLKKVEDLRWRIMAFMERVAKPRLRVAALALKDVEDPHYFTKDLKSRMNLTVTGTGRMGFDYHVDEEQVAQPETKKLIDRIGFIPIENDPGFIAGTHYHELCEWSGQRWTFLHRINTLLEALLKHLLNRTVDDKTRYSEQFHYQRVMVQVNCRYYTAHERTNLNGVGADWPSPDDVLINADTMEPLAPRYYFGGWSEQVSDTPPGPKRGSRRRKVTA